MLSQNLTCLHKLAYWEKCNFLKLYMLKVLVKALPRVQHGKNSTRVCGRETNIAQGEAEWGRDPCPSATIFILYELGSALTGLKCFWLTNHLFWLLLAIQNWLHTYPTVLYFLKSAVWKKEHCHSFDVHPHKCFNKRIMYAFVELIKTIYLLFACSRRIWKILFHFWNLTNYKHVTCVYYDAINVLKIIIFFWQS